MLGADTRATGDTTVVDKNCEKIHKIADNIYCCGAGTAADTQQVTGAQQPVFVSNPSPPSHCCVGRSRMWL